MIAPHIQITNQICIFEDRYKIRKIRKKEKWNGKWKTNPRKQVFSLKINKKLWQAKSCKSLVTPFGGQHEKNVKKKGDNVDIRKTTPEELFFVRKEKFSHPADPTIVGTL